MNGVSHGQTCYPRPLWVEARNRWVLGAFPHEHGRSACRFVSLNACNIDNRAVGRNGPGTRFANAITLYYTIVLTASVSPGEDRMSVQYVRHLTASER